MKFLGYVILSQSELQLRDELAAQKRLVTEAHLAVQTERAEKAYAEVEFYRGKFEEAQERADRQLDAFMQSAGMPEVTTTGQRERAVRETKAADQWKQKENELGELYGETINTSFTQEGLELTPELQAESDALLKELKSEQDALASN